MGKYTLEQFFSVRRYQGNMAFSPDGTEVAYITDTSGQFNIWRQSVKGGWPFQVTTFDKQTCRGVQWAPDGHLYFLADRNGDEKFQVYRVPARGGLPENLTNRPDVQFMGIDLSRDGSALYYAGNAVEPTQNHIFRRDLATGETRTLCGGSGIWFPGGESPDGRKVLVVSMVSNSISYLQLYDLATGELKQLGTAPAPAKQMPGPWTPDGSGFYFTSDAGREFSALCAYDLASGGSRLVEQPEWDVVGLTGDRSGRYLLWMVNEGGYTRPYMRDLTTGALLQLPADMGSGMLEMYELSHDARRLVYRISSPNKARDIFVHDVGNTETSRLTYSLLGGVEEADLAVPDLVRFPTFDREIYGWLYKPKHIKPGERIGVVLSVHGGPEAQELPTYSPMYQYLTDQGVAVLAPNIRGSTGYGKTYQQLIHRDWGGGDLKDLAACAEYLRSLDWVDPDRIAIFGGSYGGFATLQAVTRLPQYWACGVDFCGPSNLVTFCRAVPPTWRAMLKAWVGDPEEDVDLLMERSPITYVDSVRCPMMVLQGAMDPRVVKAESDQMVERLRERGIPVEYLVYEDEGHGFTKRHNQVAGFKAIAEYLLKHLNP